VRRRFWFNNILGICALAAVVYSFTTQAILGMICIYCCTLDTILIIYIASIFLLQKRLWS
jgi:hypothetical protein